MITRKELEKERKALFDDKFNHISDDEDRIKKFCNILREITGVQVCNVQSGTYEYIEQVYNSTVAKLQ